MKLGWVRWLALLTGLGLGNTAAAHPLVDQGHERLDEGDFTEALELFDRAEAADDLVAEDVPSLLVGRALVQLALRDEPALDRELTRLAAIAPDYRFAAHLPPDLRARFDRISAGSPGRLGVEVIARRASDHVRLEAKVLHDVNSLVRDVRIQARVVGQRWRFGRSPFALPAEPHRAIEYRARVIGIGGATITQTASRVPGVPSARTSKSLGLAEPLEKRRKPLRDEGSAPVWPWLAGGAVAAAVTVLVVVLLARGTDTTARPRYPVVR